MELSHAALLLGAGLAAGAVNAVAGGGSLVTFPALLATGLGQVPANVTNSISVCPGYLASVVATRQDLDRRRALALLPVTVAGTAVGCALLLATPPRAFALVVPFLVLGAAAVLAFQERLRGLVTGPHGTHPVALHLFTGLASVYGGYFGAAMGVMLVAVLGLMLDDTLPRVGALKNAISAVVGLVTATAFGLFGPVDWAAVAVLTPATLIGGYAGGRLARRLPPAVLRATIVVFGTVVGAVLLVKALRG